MRIKSNSMLPSDNKKITINSNCLYASDGPNCVGRLDLSSMLINFDSFFSSNMTLQPESKDMPIMYGFLGTNITFITIVAHYQSDAYTCEYDNYIEYYFEDQPLIRRTFTDILMLSGNDAHRIPQMYLYNPGEKVVNLEIMIANEDENEITAVLNPEFNIFEGLTYNSIVSDQMYGTNCTGSTQYEILDPLTISGTTGDIQIVIPYVSIDIKEIKDNVITIITTSDTPIKLVFLSNFNALQAFSRMEWVYEDSLNRYLTTSSPDLDVAVPVITFINPVITTPIDKAELVWRYVERIDDVRDGIIDKSNVDLIIINNHSGEELEEIVIDGDYSLIFSVSDLAGNIARETKHLSVDTDAPIITFNDVDTMNLTSDTMTPGIIQDTDINDLYVNNVWDSVDGIIAKSGVTIMITSGGTPLAGDITSIGDYYVIFTVSDFSSNVTTEIKPLKVIETIPPEIIFNDVFYGLYLSAFTMSLSSDTAITGITTIEDIRLYSLSGVSDNYDGIIDINNVVITTPTIIPITTPTTDVIIRYEVSDVSGNITIVNKNLNVII